VTTHSLAQDYFKRCKMRLLALQTLLEAGAYPDVVRESQEIVELLLKGFLRLYNIDPPKWHDVSQVLIENQSLFAQKIKDSLAATADFSKYLRRERENAFYGEDDMIPLEHYNEQVAQDCYDRTKKLIELFSDEFEQ